MRLASWGRSGYMAGPAQWPPGEDKVQRFCDSARQTLPEDLREDFLSGYTLVSGQFEQLAAGGEKAKEETIADQQQKKQSDAERLAEREAIAARTESIAKAAEESRAALNSQVAEIDSRLAPLAAEYQRLDAQGRAITSRILDLEGQIASIYSACRVQCKDSKSACYHTSDINRLENAKIPLIANFRDLEDSANRVSGRELARSAAQTGNEQLQRGSPPPRPRASDARQKGQAL